jgi:hypothetical protein
VTGRRGDEQDVGQPVGHVAAAVRSSPFGDRLAPGGLGQQWPHGLQKRLGRYRLQQGDRRQLVGVVPLFVARGRGQRATNTTALPSAVSSANVPAPPRKITA